MNSVRNFVIISHVDHGKSTLADRFLEITNTVDARQMRPQYLDQMAIERERGITIKMAPVRMVYQPAKILNKTCLEIKNSKLEIPNSEYILNLIDTPGHSDFSYEVSRALAAVEGAVLLVDVTQGVQAQTLVNFRLAQKSGLAIVGAVNKIDMAHSEDALNELADLLRCRPDEIYRISGKTGEGVENLLRAVIEKVPPPKEAQNEKRAALVFDSRYDDHKGVIAFVRVMGGKFCAGDATRLVAAGEGFKIKEVGYFTPLLKKADALLPGEIGYIATGIKNPGILRIGDTIGEHALHGYREPNPVVFVSLYPEDAGAYDDCAAALEKLRLNDSSLRIEQDFNEVLGRGFKVGFLGSLHFEITAERLKREFGIRTVSTFPSVAYTVRRMGKTITVVSADELTEDYDEVLEPMIAIEILMPPKHLGGTLRLKGEFRMRDIETSALETRSVVRAKMPLTGLLADFDSRLKSASEGMASFSYTLSGEEKTDVQKVEILVAGDPVPGLTRLLYADTAETESRRTLLKLKEILPRQQFAQALQAKSGGKILAREDIPALRKDVTGYLYGGDRTRKMKLWKKQQKGKKRLKALGTVRISADMFRELLRK